MQQPPIACPSQSAQVPEFSDSKDFEANYHEGFNDPDVFSGNPSPAHSLVLHYPTNPFTFESTPTSWHLQSSTDFEMTMTQTVPHHPCILDITYWFQIAPPHNLAQSFPVA